MHQGPHESHDDGRDRRRLAVNPFHGATNPLGGMTEAPPTHRLPDSPLPLQTAYRLVHDELMLDGSARPTWPPSSPPGWSRRPGC
ncbi:hypothetical protein FM21_01630 [Streptomyces mutabilis]|uniref:Uncharacterized protein n=1 Tax=Streptomyces mutabilis TaxID=67332 RepID=A0A086N171_9ACTN|nr:hypothetical protein FM21_01630 [Streptomyces mutabilis]